MTTLRAAAAALLTCSLVFSLTPEQKQENIDSFEYVWKTIRDKHWEKNPAGLNWKAVHDELRPKIDRADTMEAARAVMTEMLGRLHQSHFSIVPSDLYSSLDNSHSKIGENTTGMDARVIGLDALVTSVDPESPAAAAGVRTGWAIRNIGTVELAPLIAKADEAYHTSTLRELVLRRTVLSKLEGKEGESTDIEFLDGANQRVVKKIVHVKPKGNLTKYGYLWPAHIWIESKRVSEKIGYTKFNMFLDPEHVMAVFGDAVQSCMQCDGFIVDLRGNPGGIGAMAMGMAGWFIDKPGQELGKLYLRDSVVNFVVYPRPATFSGPLAILVDGTSASTSEIFAGGLKDLGRARIFGSRTAAAALPSVFEVLPNGDGFQYAIANYISQGGKPLEGIGAIPDVDVPLTRESLLAGRDRTLDAAMRWIERSKAGAVERR